MALTCAAPINTPHQAIRFGGVIGNVLRSVNSLGEGGMVLARIRSTVQAAISRNANVLTARATAVQGMDAIIVRSGWGPAKHVI